MKKNPFKEGTLKWPHKDCPDCDGKSVNDTVFCETCFNKGVIPLTEEEVEKEHEGHIDDENDLMSDN